MPIGGVLSYSNNDSLEEIIEILFYLIWQEYFEENHNFSIKVSGNYLKVKKVEKGENTEPELF
jgi:hypothetical protein